MYKRILIPLDGSKVGEAALPCVEELISQLPPEPKVEVTLIQAVIHRRCVRRAKFKGGKCLRSPADRNESHAKLASLSNHLDPLKEGLQLRIGQYQTIQGLHHLIVVIGRGCPRDYSSLTASGSRSRSSSQT